MSHEGQRSLGGFDMAGIFSVSVVVLVLILILGGVGAWYVALQHERATQAAIHAEFQERAAAEAARAAAQGDAAMVEAAELDVEALSKEELWALGCKRFGWDEPSQEDLDKVTAEELRAWLLEDLKWADIGDHGYADDR